MSMVSLAFDLDDNRISRLNDANIHSLKELQRVLAAVDLQARVELREPAPSRPLPKPQR